MKTRVEGRGSVDWFWKEGEEREKRRFRTICACMYMPASSYDKNERNVFIARRRRDNREKQRLTR